MITTRIASTAAAITFGFAALGGAFVAVAAPANAAPSTSTSVSEEAPSDPSIPARLDPSFARTHVHLIPHSHFRPRTGIHPNLHPTRH
jgi:hypothetical protein